MFRSCLCVINVVLVLCEYLFILGFGVFVGWVNYENVEDVGCCMFWVWWGKKFCLEKWSREIRKVLCFGVRWWRFFLVMEFLGYEYVKLEKVGLSCWSGRYFWRVIRGIFLSFRSKKFFYGWSLVGRFWFVFWLGFLGGVLVFVLFLGVG